MSYKGAVLGVAVLAAVGALVSIKLMQPDRAEATHKESPGSQPSGSPTPSKAGDQFEVMRSFASFEELWKASGEGASERDVVLPGEGQWEVFGVVDGSPSESPVKLFLVNSHGERLDLFDRKKPEFSEGQQLFAISGLTGVTPGTYRLRIESRLPWKLAVHTKFASDAKQAEEQRPFSP